MTRKERFEDLCKEYLGGVPQNDGFMYDSTAEEDAAEYLYGDKPLQRFCLVTTGGEIAYLYPDAETLEGIVEVLGWKVGDVSYGEGPVCVVDLDTGTKLLPQWHTLQWSETSLAPTAS